MAGFKLQAEIGNSSGSTEGNKVDPSLWAEWNKYKFSAFEEATIDKGGRLIKSAPTVGIVKLLVDMGFQPQLDGEFDVKSGITSPAVGVNENTPEEIEYMEQFPSSYFKWAEDFKTKKIIRKQCSPRKPEHEIGIYVDFPDVMLDMSKHPYSTSTEPDMKPLRVFINGMFKGVHTPIRTAAKRDGSYPDNTIYRIIKAAGKEQEFLKDFDIGLLADAACKFELSMTLTEEGGCYEKAIKPSKITEVKAGNVVVTVEEQIPETDVPFIGILMNGGDYSESNLSVLRYDIKQILKKSVKFYPNKDKNPDFSKGMDYLDSDLGKALEALEETTKNSTPSEASTPAHKVVKEDVQESPEEKDFDEDDIPF